MARSRSLALVLFTFLSSIKTSPEVCCSNPAMILNNVDFPQPLGPTKVRNSPSSISKLRLFKTSVFPKDLFIFCSLINLKGDKSYN